MVNVPINEKLTVRGVVYVDNQGGYIDNVVGQRNLTESARFRPEGTVRSNGLPVSAGRKGFQSTADLSGVNFIDADNSTRVEEDFNDTTYSGVRLSALWNINDDWSLTRCSHRARTRNRWCVFRRPQSRRSRDSALRRRFLRDAFSNTNWTLAGRIGELEAIYTGAFTDRETDQFIDYADYIFVGQYLPYYICDGSVTYPGASAPSGTCRAPNMFVKSTSQTEVSSHEVRFSTDAERRVSATVGGFYSTLDLAEKNDFTYPRLAAGDCVQWRDRLRTEFFR